MPNPSRRVFLGAAPAGVAWAQGAASRPGPNDRVNLAVVGIRGRGKDHIRNFAKIPHARVDTLCDVDERLWPEAAELAEQATGQRPRFQGDLRRVLDDKSIDAVSLALPNHWHALACVWACQAGKDVYLEKPGSHNLWEGRKTVEAANKYNRIVQIGTQYRSRPGIRAAMDFLHAGKLGKLYMVRAVVFRPRERLERRAEAPAPNGVAYDLWLGPAPWRPFNPGRFHYNWHWFWDTGNGETGNNGPHAMDLARWALHKYEHPARIQSMGGLDGWDSFQETPNSQISVLEYAGGERVQLEVRNLYTNAEDGVGEGLFFYGSEGWMRTNYGSWATFFGRKHEPGPAGAPEPRPLPEPHFENFLHAVRTRNRDLLHARIEEGHLTSAMCHLANIAYRTRRTLVFQSDREEFPGDAEANSYLRRRYRYPYVMPDPV